MCEEHGERCSQLVGCLSKESALSSQRIIESLEQAVGGLSVSKSGIAVAGHLDAQLMTNGVAAYRSAEWLRTQYHELGLEQETIARAAGVKNGYCPNESS